MKPLIDFKLKHVSSSYDDEEKAYLLYDLKIAKELVGYEQMLFDKQVRYKLSISDSWMTCWIIDDYGNGALCFSLLDEKEELDIQDVEELQTILNLFKQDMYLYIIDNKSMHEWLHNKDIHVTI